MILKGKNLLPRVDLFSARRLQCKCIHSTKLCSTNIQEQSTEKDIAQIVSVRHRQKQLYISFEIKPQNRTVIPSYDEKTVVI